MVAQELSFRQSVLVCLRKFCAKTTLRALPRLARANSAKSRVFWLLVFLLLLSLAIVCVVLILKSYFLFRTIVVTREVANAPSPFPSVTVCAHRPISLRGVKVIQSFSPKWFTAQYEIWAYKYEQAQREMNSSNIKAPIPYPTMSTYFQLFPTPKTIIVSGRYYEEIIFECLVNLGSSKRFVGVGQWYYCNTTLINAVRVLHPSYFNCYMITMRDKDILNANNLHLFMNLENYDSGDGQVSALNECEQCIRWRPETWRKGARISIHPPETRPLTNEFIDLSAGSVNSILFNSRKHSLMTPDYGVCSNARKNTTIEDKGYNFTYTQEACIQEILQAHIIANCSCVDPTLPLKDSDQEKYPYCESYPWYKPNPITEVEINRFNCLVNVKEGFNLQAAKVQCRVLCHFYSYKFRLSATQGIHSSMLLYLYRKMLQKKTKVPIMEKVDIAFKRGNFTLAQKYLREAKSFTDNFLIFSLNRADFSVTEKTQYASFTLPNLLSMMGGVCSLFIGFSIFVLIELLELIFNIFWPLLSLCFQKKGAYSPKATSRSPENEAPMGEVKTVSSEIAERRKDGEGDMPYFFSNYYSY